MGWGAVKPSEVWWREHYTWLLEQGYELRERYKPDWVPSWKGRGRDQAIKCEDGQPSREPVILDATSVKDGSIVALKKIRSSHSRTEIEISRLLNSPELRSSPKNHTVPLYDVLRTVSKPEYDLIVIPALRHLHNTLFATVGEVIDCVGQLIEGLDFLHFHKVAHRDCHLGNIMLDAAPMYPGGSHFTSTLDLDMNRAWTAEAHPLTRTQCSPPVKYYFIDLGLAIHFEDDSEPTLAMPAYGGDKSPPEFQGDGMNQQYNPFPTDVYYLGNALREEFLDGFEPVSHGYRGVDFLRPLITEMMHVEPAKRPTMPEVVTKFEKLVAGLTQLKLRTPVSSKDEFAIHSFFRGFGRWKRTCSYWTKGLPAIPRTSEA